MLANCFFHRFSILVRFFFFVGDLGSSHWPSGEQKGCSYRLRRLEQCLDRNLNAGMQAVQKIVGLAGYLARIDEIMLDPEPC